MKLFTSFPSSLPRLVRRLPLYSTREPPSELCRLPKTKLAVHMAAKQHPTGRTSDDDLSAIISTNKRMGYLICDLSELNLTSESTCPSPTISPGLRAYHKSTGTDSERLALLGSH